MDLFLILKVVAALAAALMIYWLGAALIRNFAQTPPPDDEVDPSTLDSVDVRFECTVCGSRVTMTAAPGGEVPTAPRHCMEEMQLVADHESQ